MPPDTNEHLLSPETWAHECDLIYYNLALSIINIKCRKKWECNARAPWAPMFLTSKVLENCSMLRPAPPPTCRICMCPRWAAAIAQSRAASPTVKKAKKALPNRTSSLMKSCIRIRLRSAELALTLKICLDFQTWSRAKRKNVKLRKLSYRREKSEKFSFLQMTAWIRNWTIEKWLNRRQKRGFSQLMNILNCLKIPKSGFSADYLEI